LREKLFGVSPAASSRALTPSSFFKLYFDEMSSTEDDDEEVVACETATY
jgi:hypothetical protein